MASEPIKVSNSEMQAFKQCRRKWWLSYYRRLTRPREETTGIRAIGTRVHAVVAHYYDTNRDQTEALALHDWSVALDAIGLDEFQAAELTSEADLSRAMLEGYFEWLEETGEDQFIEVLGIEEPVETTIDVNGTPVTVRAKLDLRVRNTETGDDYFLDHKTVQEFTTPTKTLHLDEQMLLYHWLTAIVLQKPVEGAVYNMIRKVKRTARSKPPFYMRFTVRHSPQEIASFYTRMVGTLQVMLDVRTDLDAGKDPLAIVYPTPSRDCTWKCDFYAVCPLIDRPQDGGGEGMIEMMYVEGDPYARYDEDKPSDPSTI